jgi:hypothetical protein
VFDAEGKPIAGAVVRGDNQIRGPAVATSEDGSFVLPGLVPGAPLRFFHPAGDGIAHAVVEGAREGVPLLVRIAPDGLLSVEGADPDAEPPAPPPPFEPPGPAPHVVRVAGDEILEGRVEPAGWPNYGESEVTEGALLTRAAGPAVLILECRDAGELRFRVELPDGEPTGILLDPADAIDLEPIRRAVVRLQLPPGLPPGGVRYHASEMPYAEGPDAVEPEDAAVSIDSFLEGDTIRVKVPCRLRITAAWLATVDRRLTEPGETEIAWPSGVVEFSFESPDGAPAEGTLFLDGHLYPSAGGRVRVAGIAPGLHRAIASPVTRRWGGSEARFRLGEGERATRAVRFRER